MLLVNQRHPDCVFSCSRVIYQGRRTSSMSARQLVFTWKPSVEFGLCTSLIWSLYSWREVVEINIMVSECTLAKCANYIVICTLVWEHYSSPARAWICEWNQIFVCISTERHMGKTEDNICPPYYGLFDLCSVQMGRHAPWFHTPNATVTNDSGCDPMSGTLSRTNEKARWMDICGCGVTAAVDCPLFCKTQLKKTS